jgi:hypothetical protein
MPKPALLTIQSGISQIGYATPRRSWRPRRKRLQHPAAEIVSKPSHQRIEKILPQNKTDQFSAVVMRKGRRGIG